MELDSQLRSSLESTRLGASVTRDEVLALADEADSLGLAGVCIPPLWVRVVAGRLSSSRVRTVTVANFPFGDRRATEVRTEILASFDEGATEVDVVAPLPLVLDENLSLLARYLEQALGGLEQHPTKLILETAALGPQQIRRLTRLAENLGCRWVKTSTGFHPRGGADEEAVRLLRAAAPHWMGVKASGGIRTREEALAMLRAGADRLGTSLARAVLLLEQGQASSY